MEEILNRQFFSNLLALAHEYDTLRMQNLSVIYGDQPYAQKHSLSLVFVKRNGQWFLKHDQTTVGQES